MEKENVSKKNRLTTLMLCWFLGFFGVHRLYAGKLGAGFLMAYGTIVSLDNNEIIDDVILSYMRGPYSYTGENVEKIVNSIVEEVAKIKKEIEMI